MAQKIQPYLDGICTYVSDLLNQDADLSLALNCWFPKVGILEKRGGIVFKGNNPTSESILGLHSFYTGLSDGSGGYKKYFYQIAGSTGNVAILKYNATTFNWDQVWGLGSGMTTTEPFETVNFLNNMFVVNPDIMPRVVNGTDGGSVSVTANLNGAPAYAAHIEVFDNRVYMANCTINTYLYPSRVYFSSLPFGKITTVKGDQSAVATSMEVADNKYLKTSLVVDIREYDGTLIKEDVVISGRVGTTTVTMSSLGGIDLYSGDEIWIADSYQGSYEIIWNTTEDYFPCGENDGEGINSIKRLGDLLFMFKPSSVWRYDGNSLLNITADDKGLGAVSGRSVARGKTSLYFLSQMGFYQLNGSSGLQNISGKIDNIIDGIDWSTAKNAVGWCDRQNYYCHVPTVTIKNDDYSTKRTLTNAVFVYNMRQFNWTIFTGIEATAAASFIEDGQTNYYIGASDGQVKQVFSGYKDQTATSTYIDVPMEVETKDYYFGSPEQWIQYDRFFPLIDIGNGLTCQYSIDGGQFVDFVPEGKNKDNLTKLTFPDTAYGRRIKFKFKVSSQGITKLKGFVAYFNEKEPEFYG